MSPAAANDSTGPHCATFELPIWLKNPTNGAQGRDWKRHHFARKRHHAAVALVAKRKLAALQGRESYVVKLARVIGPRGRQLDDDGLRSAFKAIRDQVARLLDEDDSPYGRMRWEYEQQKGKRWAVRIEVRALQALAPEAG